jgi:hypothetical protein
VVRRIEKQALLANDMQAEVGKGGHVAIVATGLSSLGRYRLAIDAARAVEANRVARLQAAGLGNGAVVARDKVGGAAQRAARRSRSGNGEILPARCEEQSHGGWRDECKPSAGQKKAPSIGDQLFTFAIHGVTPIDLFASSMGAELHHAFSSPDVTDL